MKALSHIVMLFAVMLPAPSAFGDMFPREHNVMTGGDIRYRHDS